MSYTDQFRDNEAFVRLRVRRIQEDIQAAEEKVRRIENRIQRDRSALAAWQARLAAFTVECEPSK